MDSCFPTIFTHNDVSLSWTYKSVHDSQAPKWCSKSYHQLPGESDTIRVSHILDGDFIPTNTTSFLNGRVDFEGIFALGPKVLLAPLMRISTTSGFGTDWDQRMLDDG